MIGLVVLMNIDIRADSSQRDLIRSRAELNAVTYAAHNPDGYPDARNEWL